MSDILLHCTECGNDDNFEIYVFDQNEVWAECLNCGNATEWSNDDE